ncbi:MAG: PA2779 family protein [Gammaproteobacteria bacterium]|nr:PA2779 family protein [Gammaproteobacteria bacterium]
MQKFVQKQWISKVMICFTFFLSMQSIMVQAGMVTTNAAIKLDDKSYTTTELQKALESEELKAQLTEMGVDITQLQDRIASLTPEEISNLNVELAHQPAGAGVIGGLVTIFVVLIVTDMLCATDVFNFVNCIN